MNAAYFYIIGSYIAIVTIDILCFIFGWADVETLFGFSLTIGVPITIYGLCFISEDYGGTLATLFCILGIVYFTSNVVNFDNGVSFSSNWLDYAFIAWPVAGIAALIVDSVDTSSFGGTSYGRRIYTPGSSGTSSSERSSPSQTPSETKRNTNPNEGRQRSDWVSRYGEHLTEEERRVLDHYGGDPTSLNAQAELRKLQGDNSKKY